MLDHELPRRSSPFGDDHDYDDDFHDDDFHDDDDDEPERLAALSIAEAAINAAWVRACVSTSRARTRQMRAATPATQWAREASEALAKDVLAAPFGRERP